jgi:L-arabinokinase
MSETSRDLKAQYPDLKRFEAKSGELVTQGYFERGTNIFINRTPGRLDLMGGNDDYTGGLVFESTIREATLVAIQPRADQKVTFYNPAVRS